MHYLVRLCSVNEKLGKDGGFSLIAITWIVLILSILATGVLSLALTSRQTYESVAQDVQERLLVESVIDIFMHRYFYDDDNKVYRSGQLSLYGQDLAVYVQYESGKFNINRADHTLLSAIFAASGQGETTTDSLAAAIIDWRDSDDDVGVGGAEEDEYDAVGISGRPRNGPFGTVGELLAVLNLSAGLYKCVRPLLTVYSLNGEPNLAYAPASVRQVFQWAFDNNYKPAERTWIDPDDVVPATSVSGVGLNLAGQSLQLNVSLEGGSDSHFSAIVRFGSTSESDVTYNRLTPLRREVQAAVDPTCPFL